GHGPAGKRAEPGQAQRGEPDGKDESDQGDKDRFAEELPDELFAERAQRFTDAYFSCALFAARRGQVHKVDAGEQKTEDADDPDEPHEADAAFADATIGFVVMQV